LQKMCDADRQHRHAEANAMARADKFCCLMLPFSLRLLKTEKNKKGVGGGNFPDA